MQAPASIAPDDVVTETDTDIDLTGWGSSLPPDSKTAAFAVQLAPLNQVPAPENAMLVRRVPWPDTMTIWCDVDPVQEAVTGYYVGATRETARPATAEEAWYFLPGHCAGIPKCGRRDDPDAVYPCKAGNTLVWSSKENKGRPSKPNRSQWGMQMKRMRAIQRELKQRAAQPPPQQQQHLSFAAVQEADAQAQQAWAQAEETPSDLTLLHQAMMTQANTEALRNQWLNQPRQPRSSALSRHRHAHDPMDPTAVTGSSFAPPPPMPVGRPWHQVRSALLQAGKKPRRPASKVRFAPQVVVQPVERFTFDANAVPTEHRSVSTARPSRRTRQQQLVA